MFAKVAVLIVVLGVCACSLLALRQARLKAANELAEARLRIRAIDERVSIVRTRVAAKVTPGEIERMTRELDGALGSLIPIAQAIAAQSAPRVELVQGEQP